MVRSDAQKKAHLKYRDNAEKYEIVKSINRKSNKKRYAEDPEFREKMKAKQKEQYQKKKEKIKQEKKEAFIKEKLENETIVLAEHDITIVDKIDLKI